MKISLHYADQLDPMVRAELTQLVESIQVAFSDVGQRLSRPKSVITPTTLNKFTADGSMSFTVSTSNQLCYKYAMLTDRLMLLSIYLTGATGGAASNAIRLPLPEGYSLAGSGIDDRVINLWTTPIVLTEGGVGKPAYINTNPGFPNFLRVLKVDGLNFALTSVVIEGQVIVEVQPFNEGAA